ncbi:DNA helicase 60, putative [Plasmodium gallinaceum]|uniref:RNA helicase n=1 Tax=Plasmodium gallinaceum TaxID=5849 RepID=A0A1J1GQL2_PLAGA|nr:DNA helicase 60, putative [Plasmodium gallinaceum]CRG93575.1 DNA helicase 60, putative [Plasmodium gallinaceum]
MRNILKLKSIKCSTNGKYFFSKNFLFIKNRSSKFNTSIKKLGNNIINNEENVIKNRQSVSNIMSKSIFTENKIKNDINDDYPLKNNLNDVDENSDNYLNENFENDLKEDFTGNTQGRKINEYDNISDNFKNDDLLEENFNSDNLNENFKNYKNFDRNEIKKSHIGENGFINNKNRKYNNYEKNRKRYNNSYKDDDDQISNYSRNLNNSDRYSNLGSNLKDIEWNKIKVNIERKNLYNNNKLKNLSNEELQNELKKNNIFVNKDLSINNFITKFSDLNFHESILNYLNSKFNEPTAIQKITWPIALSGKDLIGVAETGSGKTLAYVLPCLMHIMKHKQMEINKQNLDSKENGIEEEREECHTSEINKNDVNNYLENDMKSEYEENNTYGLILLPTRELCMQVLDEIKIFEKTLNLKSVAIYGGVPKYFQINNLKKGADIIVATPGRLLDFLENGIINLLKSIYVVIDEADRLLDMGFEKQLRKIMTQVNRNKQLLFLTATWPEQVRKLAYDFCSYDPIKIQIGKNELTANKNIEQNVIISPSIDMKKKLLDWLKENYENNKILIFCDTKRNCDNLCKELRYHQYNALSIHGDKQQRERDRILNNYKSDRCNILVATDVASRGLDIKNISIVINYDVPNTIEDYIHRIGRTGRAGKKGKSILFFSYDYYVPQKLKFAKELIKLLNKTNQPIPNQLKEIAYSR